MMGIMPGTVVAIITTIMMKSRSRPKAGAAITAAYAAAGWTFRGQYTYLRIASPTSGNKKRRRKSGPRHLCRSVHSNSSICFLTDSGQVTLADRRERMRNGRCGGQGQNRTADTGIFSPLLYRLSYLAILGRVIDLSFGLG